MKVYIYALVDPRDGRYAYVGQTTNPKKRLRGHLSARDLSKNYARPTWLRKLATLGLRPQMVILEETDEENRPERERYWIARLRREGYGLKNSTEGGEGGEAGHKMPKGFGENIRRKLLGKPKSKSHRSHIGEALSGLPKSSMHKERLSLAQRGISTHKADSKHSRYIGVSWRDDRGYWIVLIKPSPSQKQVYVGSSRDEEEAARMYDAAALHYFGPNARLNFPA